LVVTFLAQKLSFFFLKKEAKTLSAADSRGAINFVLLRAHQQSRSLRRLDMLMLEIHHHVYSPRSNKCSRQLNCLS